MKRAYLLGGLVCAVCVALAVYYLLPGIPHVLAFSGRSTDRHIKHAVVFFALAAVALVGARFAANAAAGE